MAHPTNIRKYLQFVYMCVCMKSIVISVEESSIFHLSKHPIKTESMSLLGKYIITWLCNVKQLPSIWSQPFYSLFFSCFQVFHNVWKQKFKWKNSKRNERESGATINFTYACNDWQNMWRTHMEDIFQENSELFLLHQRSKLCLIRDWIVN